MPYCVSGPSPRAWGREQPAVGLPVVGHYMWWWVVIKEHRCLGVWALLWRVGAVGAAGRASELPGDRVAAWLADRRGRLLRV